MRGSLHGAVGLLLMTEGQIPEVIDLRGRCVSMQQ